MSEEKRPSGDLLFEASDLDRALIDVLPRLTSPTRWPAFNAVRHLNRAWRIREIDPEMAVFRAITAEEEAATSVFLSLKQHRYPGADKLKPRDHVQKNALLPFFDAVTRVLSTMQDPPPLQLHLDASFEPPRLVFRLQIQHPERGLVWAAPQPPLHFTARRSTDGGASYRVEDFAQGVDQVVSRAGAKSMKDHLRERANSRNRLLYASPGGYPQFGGKIDASMAFFQRNVFTLIRMYLMIEPYPQHQNFVQQVLLSFLKALELFEGEIEFE
jgi:hypothetical protein